MTGDLLPIDYLDQDGYEGRDYVCACVCVLVPYLTWLNADQDSDTGHSYLLSIRRCFGSGWDGQGVSTQAYQQHWGNMSK